MPPIERRVSGRVQQYVQFAGSQSEGSTLRISLSAESNASASDADHAPLNSSKSEFRAGFFTDASNNRRVALLRLSPSRRLVSRIVFSTSGGRFLSEAHAALQKMIVPPRRAGDVSGRKPLVLRRSQAGEQDRLPHRPMRRAPVGVYYFLPRKRRRTFTARAWPRPNIRNCGESASLFTTLGLGRFRALMIPARQAHK